MTTKNNGGPAFPETQFGGHTNRHPVDQLPGMTLRDYFAAKAMQSILNGVTTGTVKRNDGRDMVPQDYAQASYEIADAMLAERSK